MRIQPSKTRLWQSIRHDHNAFLKTQQQQKLTTNLYQFHVYKHSFKWICLCQWLLNSAKQALLIEAFFGIKQPKIFFSYPYDMQAVAVMRILECMRNIKCIKSQCPIGASAFYWPLPIHTCGWKRGIADENVPSVNLIYARTDF